MKEKQTHPELERSEVIDELPLACADELAAVEFFEKQRWGDSPCCPHCQNKNVYKMLGKDGLRNKRFLWRCRGCDEQFTVRIGTVYEESRLPLRHWAYTFWRACSSKKGVSAREIERHCQISYKSALFLLHRVRFALTPNDDEGQGKLSGELEIDETYVGGKARPDAFGTKNKTKHVRGGSDKTPVVAMVQRNGEVRSKVFVKVNAKNLHQFVRKNVEKGSTVNTDLFAPYRNVLYGYAKHNTVNHSIKEYVCKLPDGSLAHVNTAESLFSLLKRGLMGIYHSVSPEHLHRYLGEFDFRWNSRKLNDGERVSLAIQSSIGKRLTYENSKAQA